MFECHLLGLYVHSVVSCYRGYRAIWSRMLDRRLLGHSCSLDYWMLLGVNCMVEAVYSNSLGRHSCSARILLEANYLGVVGRSTRLLDVVRAIPLVLYGDFSVVRCFGHRVEPVFDGLICRA